MSLQLTPLANYNPGLKTKKLWTGPRVLQANSPISHLALIIIIIVTASVEMYLAKKNQYTCHLTRRCIPELKKPTCIHNPRHQKSSIPRQVLESNVPPTPATHERLTKSRTAMVLQLPSMMNRKGNRIPHLLIQKCQVKPSHNATEIHTPTYCEFSAKQI